MKQFRGKRRRQRNILQRPLVPLVVKNSPADAEDTRDAGSTSALGGPPGGGNGNLLLYSCLENLMDRGAWRATVPRVVKRRFTTEATQHTHTHNPHSQQKINRTENSQGLWENRYSPITFQECRLQVVKQFGSIYQTSFFTQNSTSRNLSYRYTHLYTRRGMHKAVPTALLTSTTNWKYFKCQ